jgi:hypothetical protein
MPQPEVDNSHTRLPPIIGRTLKTSAHPGQRSIGKPIPDPGLGPCQAANQASCVPRLSRHNFLQKRLPHAAGIGADNRQQFAANIECLHQLVWRSSRTAAVLTVSLWRPASAVIEQPGGMTLDKNGEINNMTVDPALLTSLRRFEQAAVQDKGIAIGRLAVRGRR